MENTDYTQENKEKIAKTKQLFEMSRSVQDGEEYERDLFLTVLNKRANIVLFFGIIEALLSLHQIFNLLQYIWTYVINNALCAECGVIEFFIGIICLVPATILTIIISVMLAKDRKRLKTVEESPNSAEMIKNIKIKHGLVLFMIILYLTSVIFTVLFYFH